VSLQTFYNRIALLEKVIYSQPSIIRLPPPSEEVTIRGLMYSQPLIIRPLSRGSDNRISNVISFLFQYTHSFLNQGSIFGITIFVGGTYFLRIYNFYLVIAGIGYWAIGWAFAYGPNYGPSAPFIGGSQFFLIGTENYSTFFFQYVFAATASTIITGAVAERIEFFAFCCYSFVISCKTKNKVYIKN
jgi:hypothetical protein